MSCSLLPMILQKPFYPMHSDCSSRLSHQTSARFAVQHRFQTSARFAHSLLTDIGRSHLFRRTDFLLPHLCGRVFCCNFTWFCRDFHNRPDDHNDQHKHRQDLRCFQIPLKYSVFSPHYTPSYLLVLYLSVQVPQPCTNISVFYHSHIGITTLPPDLFKFSSFL